MVTHSILFEKMTLSDVDGVLAIERKVFSSPWSKRMFLSELSENPFSFSYVAREEEQQQVVGYIFFWVVFDELHIMNVAIHPAWQRRGIGEDLICLALHIGRERRVRVATLEVRVSNLPAQALYRKLGFREAGLRRNYYNQPTEDALLFQCNLDRFRRPYTDMSRFGKGTI